MQRPQAKSEVIRGMTMTLEDYMAIPYVLVVESFEDDDGEWKRRASYPELPGCSAEGFWAVDVIEEVEQLRSQLLQEMWKAGTSIPVPRQPLAWRRPVLDQSRVEFAKWLVEHGRISES